MCRMHDHTYRMLGREHEADLERDALKQRRAAEARARPGDSGEAPRTRSRRAAAVHAHSRILALLTRAARAGS
jgi:hypothetical protein